MTISIAVVGGGAWGTALASHACASGHSVRQWYRRSEVVERILATRVHQQRLPGVRLPDSLEPTVDLAHAVADAELVLAAVPTPFARGIYRRMKASLSDDVPCVIVSKGIEEDTLALPLEVLASELGPERPGAVLSGPSFAAEVARGCPTAVVVASTDAELASLVQRALSSSTLRLYTNRDTVGVQIAGALKNVVAISAGLSDGLGMGSSARAALITRGLAEITRLGCKLGGRAATFSGLAGMGDLTLSCNGDLSRNRQIGQRLAAGESLDDALRESPGLPEGVRTTRSAIRLAERESVSMPIVEEIHRVLYESGSIQDSLVRLMSRPLSAEDREGHSK